MLYTSSFSGVETIFLPCWISISLDMGAQKSVTPNTPKEPEKACFSGSTPPSEPLTISIPFSHQSLGLWAAGIASETPKGVLGLEILSGEPDVANALTLLAS